MLVVAATERSPASRDTSAASPWQNGRSTNRSVSSVGMVPSVFCNGGGERLATKLPSVPLGLLASPLQRFVRPCPFFNCNQPESDATTITRECSGILTPESNNRTTPFSIIPTTATGLRGRRCVSRGRGTSPGADSGIGGRGSAASCSSNDFRLSLRSSG